MQMTSHLSMKRSRLWSSVPPECCNAYGEGVRCSDPLEVDGRRDGLRVPASTATVVPVQYNN